MNHDHNEDTGRPDEQAWENAQSSGGAGQSQEQRFPGETAGQQDVPGYGDQGPAGQGADATGGTSVMGEAEDEEDEPSDDDVHDALDNDRM